MHINVECVVHMFRVVAALLLAAAALAAVDLSGLVDVVYNKSSPLERFAPTYVFEVNGCRALVYVADPALKNSPMAARQTYEPVYYPRNKTLRPLTSAEVERLLNALFQVFGQSIRAEVAIVTMGVKGYGGLRVKARDAAQLAEEVRGFVRVDFYLGAADAREALEKGAEQAAYLSLVMWRRGDLVAFFAQDDSARLTVKTANLSAAVEALKKVREAVGEVWNSVEVELWHGPYFVPDDVALEATARRLERELWRGWVFRDEWGWVRLVWGFVDVFFVGELGPLYVVFSYLSGATPDRATAERFVRRFVELSSYCESPLVVEFWPRPGVELALITFLLFLWLSAVVGAALIVAAVFLVITRLRR